MNSIRVSKPKRRLPPGFDWQTYAVKSIRFITKEEVDATGEGTSGMKSSYEDWHKKIQLYIHQRAEELGLVVLQIVAQFIEEPNEHKAIEKLLWDQRGAVIVWAAWAYLDGPVPGDTAQDGVLPCLGFWPKDLPFVGGVAEIFDISSLSSKAEEAPTSSSKIVVPA